MSNSVPAFTSTASETEASGIIKELYDFVNENYATCTLSAAANHLHHNFYWLSHEIKRKTGKNFTEIVQEKRLCVAAKLLEESDLNIADISISVGYDNVSYFRRLFVKRFGCTPNAYRKKINGEFSL